MRIGMISLSSLPVRSGITTYFYENFEALYRLGADITPIMLSGNGKISKAKTFPFHKEEDIYKRMLVLNWRKVDESIDKINSFDCLFFISAGGDAEMKAKESPKYFPIVKKVSVPFFVASHGLIDLKVYPFSKEWIGGQFFRGWISQKRELGSYLHLFPFFHIPIYLANWNPKAANRENKIIMNGRLISCKHHHVFLEKIKASEKDWQIIVRGESFYQYDKALLERYKNVIYKGEYSFSEREAIFENAKVAIDFSEYDLMGGYEYSALEAIQAGAIVGVSKKSGMFGIVIETGRELDPFFDKDIANEHQKFVDYVNRNHHPDSAKKLYEILKGHSS